MGITAERFTEKQVVYQIGISPSRIDILIEITEVEFANAWKNRVPSTFFGVPVHLLARRECTYFLPSIITTLACGSSVTLMRGPAGKRSSVHAFFMSYRPAGTKSDKGRLRVMAFSPRLNAARACSSPDRSALQITRSFLCDTCRDAVAVWSIFKMSVLHSKRRVSCSSRVRLAPMISGLRAIAHRLSCVCCSAGVRDRKSVV